MDERKLIEDFAAYMEQMPPMKNRSTTPADLVEGFFTHRYGEIVHAVGGAEARARGSEPSLHVVAVADLNPAEAHEFGASIVRWSGRRMAERWTEIVEERGGSIADVGGVLLNKVAADAFREGSRG